MKNYEPLSSEPSGGQETQSIANYLRVVGQLGGIALVAIGAYYAVWVLAAAIATAKSPAGWEGSVEAMAKTLKIDGAELAGAGGTKIPIGRAIAGIVFMGWNIMVVWIAMMLIGAGSRLINGTFASSPEGLAAMRELVARVRGEQNRSANAPT